MQVLILRVIMSNIINIKIEGLTASGKSIITELIVNAIIQADLDFKLYNFDAICVFGENKEMATNNFIRVKGVTTLREFGGVTNSALNNLLGGKS